MTNLFNEPQSFALKFIFQNPSMYDRIDDGMAVKKVTCQLNNQHIMDNFNSKNQLIRKLYTKHDQTFIIMISHL
jgi:hypothetical protein